MKDDVISRHGVSAWLDNMGYPKLADVIMDEKRFPPAQSEIIRCKDCKHSEHWYRDKRRCFLWHETGIDVFDDGYCNYAERKANG